MHVFNQDKKTAVYDIQEDGYTLTFTLKHDKIIVEENDGMSYLDVCLSGEYVRK